MKKKTLLFLCGLTSALTLTACQNSTEKQTNNSSETVNMENTENFTSTEVEELSLESKIEEATRGCEVVQEGETVNLGAISITVNDVTVTKEKGDWYDFYYEEGKLPEDEVYVVVNTTITQNGETDFWLNSIWLANFTDDELLIGSREINGTTLLNDDNGYNEKKDIYQGLIKDGDTVTTDLIFVINQEEETNDAHFLLEYNPTGCDLEDIESTEYCMVYLESLENVWDADTLK